jgi:hypothetical protein
MPARPGVVALDDALRVASDFVVLRSTADTRATLAQLFPPAERWAEAALFLRTADGFATHDAGGRLLARYRVDASRGYRRHGSVEVPVGGIHKVS